MAKYHPALAAGDSAGALALLADDTVILETGGVETRAGCRSHHLPGDITFAKAIQSQHLTITELTRPAYRLPVEA